MSQRSSRRRISSPPDAYTELLDHVERHSYLEDTQMTLRWDQHVAMPDGGAPTRSK